MFAERLSKCAALLSIAFTAALQLAIEPEAGWALRFLALLAFGTCWILGRLSCQTIQTIIIGAAPILPGLLSAMLGHGSVNAFHAVWMVGLFGSMLPAIPYRRWSLPPGWRLLLGAWALTLSLAWPILVAREAGFDAQVLRDTGAINSWAQLSAPHVIGWILHVVMTQLVALVWLEWLFARSESATSSAPPRVAHGLWIGASLASAVAVYQGVFDLEFLSGGLWPAERRAAGTMLDANAYGTFAALAGPLGVVSIPARGVRHKHATQAVILVLSWAGVWMSGSRTGAACALLGTALLAWGLMRSGAQVPAVRRRRQVPLLVIASGAAIVTLVLAASAVGPFRRTMELRARNPSAIARDMWDRGGYGVVARRMVRDYPLIGVGVGSFNWMAPDYWRRIADAALPFDNAQNWWRQQLTELGVLGGLPVLVWSLWMAWLALTRRSGEEGRLEATVVRGLLLALGLISLVGMPTQNPLVLLVFCYLTVRFVTVTGGPPAPPISVTPGMRQLAWTVATMLAIGYAGGHLVLARRSLSVAERAARADRDYIAGAYPPEAVLDDRESRWTGRSATFFLAMQSRWLVLRVQVHHPDAAKNPVRILVASPCQTLLDAEASDAVPRVVALELPTDQGQMRFSTQVSRTWRPSDYGIPDGRDLGAAVETNFASSPETAGGVERWIHVSRCDGGS